MCEYVGMRKLSEKLWKIWCFGLLRMTVWYRGMGHMSRSGTDARALQLWCWGWPWIPRQWSGLVVSKQGPCSYDVGFELGDALKWELSLDLDFPSTFPFAELRKNGKTQQSKEKCILWYILHSAYLFLSLALFICFKFTYVIGLNYLSTQFYIYALLSFASIFVIVCCHICYYMLPISFIFKSTYTNLGVFRCLANTWKHCLLLRFRISSLLFFGAFRHLER